MVGINNRLFVHVFDIQGYTRISNLWISFSSGALKNHTCSCRTKWWDVFLHAVIFDQLSEITPTASKGPVFQSDFVHLLSLIHALALQVSCSTLWICSYICRFGTSFLKTSVRLKGNVYFYEIGTICYHGLRNLLSYMQQTDGYIVVSADSSR